MRITHAERAIARLPGERTPFRKRVMDPTRRAGLDGPQCLGNGQLLVQTNQKMNVVRHAAGREEQAVRAAEDAADVFIEAWLEVGGYRGQSIFRAEDEVIVQGGVG